MKDYELDKIMDVFLDNYDDVLNVTIVDRITVVVLEGGAGGFSVRKPGDVNKPYNAMKLAYYRAKEQQVLDKL